MSRPIITNDGQVVCRRKRCGRVLGASRLGLLVVGGVILWNEAQYSCAECGEPYYYTERTPDGESYHHVASAVAGVSGESQRQLIYSTLNALGQHKQKEETRA
jgi:hypothetical protein